MPESRPNVIAGAASACLLAAAVLLAAAEPTLAQDVKKIFAEAAEKGKEATEGAILLVRIVGIAMLVVIGIWGIFSGFRGQVLVKGFGVAVGLLVITFAEQLVDWIFNPPSL